MKDPGLYYAENVVGGVALLDALREVGVDRIVFSSTAAVYGEPEKVPIRENAPTRPVSPYGASKLAGERELSPHRRAEEHHRAEREVHAGREQHEGHARGGDDGGRGLRAEVRQIAPRNEARLQQAEHQYGQREQQQRSMI